MMVCPEKPKKSARVSRVIAEAYKSDVGRRIGRVDPKVADEFGLETGEKARLFQRTRSEFVIFFLCFLSVKDMVDV